MGTVKLANVLSVIFILVWGGSAGAGDVRTLWTGSFNPVPSSVPPDCITNVPGRGAAVHVLVASSTHPLTRTVALPLDPSLLRGRRIIFGADVKATDVGKKPNPWNGVKVMLVIEDGTGRSYPQPEIPTGTFDWKHFSTSVAVPASATNITLILGIENAPGEVWFSKPVIRERVGLSQSLMPDANRKVFLGHSAGRLRGAMAGTELSEEDIRYFGTVWRGNVLRLQLFEAARKDRALGEYDAWLEGRLAHTDRMLSWCAKYGVSAVVDLHSPPGGQAFEAGYITAKGRIFTDPAAQEKFVEVWQRIATRYKGNRTIWGFDLVNEPDDSMVAEDCLDWNALADRAARAVRAIDPDRTLIIEPNAWGGPQGFEGFEPLDLPNVVYSFHFYQPMQFTHQGIHGNAREVSYPGLIGGKSWDRNALEQAMLPAIEFAEKYRVQMYVGEFSAIRIAPPGAAARYLEDVIGIFEKHGFDWSYHAYREWQGWSLEHEGSLDAPKASGNATDRQLVVTGWFARNEKP